MPMDLLIIVIRHLVTLIILELNKSANTERSEAFGIMTSDISEYQCDVVRFSQYSSLLAKISMSNQRARTSAWQLT